MNPKDVIYLYIIDSGEDAEHLTEICDVLESDEFLLVLALHDERDYENKSLFTALEDAIKAFSKVIDFNVRECDTKAQSIFQEISEFLQDKEIDGIILSERLSEVGKRFDKEGIPVIIY